MGRKKTLPRVEHEGVIKIIVFEHNGLRRIDVDKLKSKQRVRELMAMYHELTKVGVKWFWVETGIHADSVQIDAGFSWVIADTRDNSMNYRWLNQKAEKFCGYIVERLNGFISAMEELDDTQG